MKLKGIKLKTNKYFSPEGHSHLPELFSERSLRNQQLSKIQKHMMHQNGKHYQPEANLLSMREFGKGFVPFWEDIL